jgi:hypothetical protein
MSALFTHDDFETDAAGSGVEFGQSAEGFPVARIGDMVLAMLPLAHGGAYLGSACFVRRPLNDLRRADFYGYDGRLADEDEFRRRVHETAEHRRELHALGRVQTRMSATTPWGSSQLATIYGPGVIAHSTASHGGFYLSADRNRLIDPALRKDTRWYEEDSEWAIVALTCPDLFTAYERKCADEMIRHSWPDTWERIHGRTLAPGDSRLRDRRTFEHAHAEDWVVISAIYSVQHAGMTEAVATLGGLRGAGAERRFLVPSDEYGTRGPFGFVIDEARHQAYDGPSSFVGWRERRSVA